MSASVLSGTMAAVEALGGVDINSISCTLDVQINGAKINEPALFTEHDLVDMTPTQLNSVACDGTKPLPATIHLSSRGLSNTKEIEYKAANDKWFTHKFINVIGKYSLYETAAQWFGGIDAHHVFFEGFTDSGSSNGRYCIGWGS